MRFTTALKSRGSDESKPLGWPIFPLAFVGGLTAGALAQLLGLMGGPYTGPTALAYLGVSTAAWVSIGFLFAWPAARSRSVVAGALWAGGTMALYLFAWLFSYCAVYGIADSAGFMSLWDDERVFEIAALPASAVIGFIAVGSWRPGPIGSACLAAPAAWSLPEIMQSIVPEWVSGPVYGPSRWQYALALGLPTLLLALAPVLRARHAKINWPIFLAAAVVGGVPAFLLMRLFGSGVF